MSQNDSDLKIFNTVVKIVQAAPKSGPVEPSLKNKLEFYALYKIATNKGEAENFDKPKFYEIESKLKWRELQKWMNLSPQDAREMYIKKFGEYLIDLYYTNKKKDLLSTTDMSFMSGFDVDTIMECVNKASNYNFVKKETKEEMVSFFKENVKKLIPVN